MQIPQSSNFIKEIDHEILLSVLSQSTMALSVMKPGRNLPCPTTGKLSVTPFPFQQVGREAEALCTWRFPTLDVCWKSKLHKNTNKVILLNIKTRKKNMYTYIPRMQMLFKNLRGIPVGAQRVTNPTRIHEDAGSIPGPA